MDTRTSGLHQEEAAEKKADVGHPNRVRSDVFPKTNNVSIVPIFLIMLADAVSLTIMVPLLPFYAERYGASPVTVGALIGCYSIFQLFSAPILGRISDHVGRKPLLLVSQLGTFFSLILLAYAGSLWLIFLARIIDGITAGNATVAQAYIADNTDPKNRTMALGKILMANGIGYAIGPALTALSTRSDLKTPIFYAAGFSALSILGTLTLLPRKTKARLAEPVKNGSRFNFSAIFELFKNREVALFLIQLCFFYFAFTTYFSSLALFAERRFKYGGVPFGPREVGVVFALIGFYTASVQIFFIRGLVKKLGERKLTYLGFSLMICGYSLIGLIHNPWWLILALAFTNFGHGVARPSIVSMASQRLGSGHQGSLMGLNQSLLSLSNVVMPLAAMYLIQRGWLTAWAWLPAFFAVIGLALRIFQDKGCHFAEVKSAP